MEVQVNGKGVVERLHPSSEHSVYRILLGILPF